MIEQEAGLAMQFGGEAMLPEEADELPAENRIRFNNAEPELRHMTLSTNAAGEGTPRSQEINGTFRYRGALLHSRNPDSA
ncbi:hypothetical protein [Siccirubricoccus sp. G192]|uniref:hypothetical protein n=1 Tax=Siccirubricoccus sp. G192 TaxID=2849651 RepID=UPI001C2BD220|nr:hypothetical protein [Siccirubricoccus sp. G192]MBV1799191.1 hypothetical protein [Siccirubricoccus sp. G192]